MSLVTPLVSSLIAELTAAPGGSSLPYAPPPPPPPPPPPQPAVLAITQIGPQEAGGNVPVSYSIDKTDTGVAAVLYAAAEAPPLAADFNGAGAPTYADLGTLMLDTSGTPLDLELPDDLNGSYRLALLPSGGGDGHVAVSAPVTIDTTVAAPPPPDAMADDTGKLYWYGADATTRSGTDVTAMTDKGGAAFDLTETGSGNAPQQASAGAPIVFNSASSRLLQTAVNSAGNRLMQNCLTAGGVLRLFAVVDGATLGSGISILLSESASSTSSQSILFSVSQNTTNIAAYISATGSGGSAFTGNVTSSINATSAGLFLFEVSVTQSAWQIWVNGVSIGLGPVTAANFPDGGVWTTLGARANGTAASFPFTGAVYEVFVTGTADGSTLAAIRDQLATKYSITL